MSNFLVSVPALIYSNPKPSTRLVRTKKKEKGVSQELVRDFYKENKSSDNFSVTDLLTR